MARVDVLLVCVLFTVIEESDCCSIIVGDEASNSWKSSDKGKGIGSVGGGFAITLCDSIIKRMAISTIGLSLLIVVAFP